MPAFELVPLNEFAPARPLALTRSLFIPDVDGNWRELRVVSSTVPAAGGSRRGSTGGRAPWAIQAA